VIDGLAPPDLAAGGLAGSLRSYARLAGRTHGIAVRVLACELARDGPARPGGGVYRVAQEALEQRAAALRRRGCPRSASWRGAAGSSSRVTDDGKGFGTQTPPGGLGLSSMRERAASVGGTLAIRSAPARAPRLRLSVAVRQPMIRC